MRAYYTSQYAEVHSLQLRILKSHLQDAGHMTRVWLDVMSVVCSHKL